VSLASLRERLSSLPERVANSGPAGLVAAAALLALALALLSLADPRGLRRFRALRSDVERQERANLLLREQNAELQRIVRSLSVPVEPAALEKAAREQLGWVKPDEILFKFE
jgi:cell division protein FtsB